MTNVGVAREAGDARPGQSGVRDLAPGRRMDDVIGRGREMVLARQRADGSWQERGDMGPFTTALALVALHDVDQLPASDAREGLRWLRSRQHDDGSFPGRPFTTQGDLATTAAAWAALSLGRDAEDVAAAARARDWVDANGGLDAVVALSTSGDVSAFVLVMAKLLEPSRLSTLPTSVVLVPQLVETIARKVSFYGLTVMLAGALVVRGRVEPGGFVRSLVAGRENARAVELLTLYQNRNGSLMNVVFHTAMLLPALRAAGVEPSDPRFSGAVAWLRSRGARDRDGLFFDVYGSDVWSTASYLRALLVTGSSRSEDHVVRAVSWLLAEQCQRPHPAVTNPKPGAPRTGGWGFQSGEDAYPDCDTTSTVLDVLGRALVPDAADEPALPPALATRVCAAIASARAWLGAMQNPDGGWPSFFWGHPSKRPGPIMLRPLRLRLSELPKNDPMAWIRAIAEASEHVADPATEDVTSRVLIGLARTGTTIDAPEVRRALEFLATQQCPSGAWWGRWKVNYLPVTACVLSAFAAVGDALSKDDTRRAITWICSRQNDDGGFGETVESYRDPSLAGTGPSTAPLTGSVLLGLSEVSELGDVAAKAAAHLMDAQLPDGSWPNGDCVATLVPPNLFYFYGGSARYIPLEALGRYRACLRGAR